MIPLRVFCTIFLCNSFIKLVAIYRICWETFGGELDKRGGKVDKGNLEYGGKT